MRMRRKPYARPELAACPFNVNEPEKLKGKWKSAFKRDKLPLYIELGMGKGGHLAKLAHDNRDINFLGIDIKSEVIVVAKRNIEAVYGEEPIDNVLIMSLDIERMLNAFGDEDRAGRIYINFCNPWPKDRHKKHRLTHTKQLKIYEKIMQKGAELRFKTDDDELYEDTLGYLKEEGWSIVFSSNDFSHTPMPENIITEHEKMFMDMGKKMKGIIALPPATDSCVNES